MKSNLTLGPGEKLYHLCVLIKEDSALTDLINHLKSHSVEIKKEENLGKRELAFPVNKKRELTLASVFFTGAGAEIKKIESELKHEEYIERFLLTTWRGDLDAPVRKERVKVAKEEVVNV